MARFKGKLARYTQDVLCAQVTVRWPGNFEGPTTQELVDLVKKKKLEWPTKSVGHARMDHEMSVTMGFHRHPDTLRWQVDVPQPPTQQERAQSYLARLSDERLSGCDYGCDEHCCCGDKADGCNDALETAAEAFKDLFPELFTKTS